MKKHLYNNIYEFQLQQRYKHRKAMYTPVLPIVIQQR
jgi:hypothetical protein